MDRGKSTIRERETSQWIREKVQSEKRETSQWIREKVKSEKERHHNG
jgi:hypothetical protein